MRVETRITRRDAAAIEPHSWGKLVWFVSGALGNSDTMTVGQCHVDEGSANPRHLHPNCDEVLHVLVGNIEHSLGDEVVAMEAGDTISIPQATMHNARNIGQGEAVLVITFSSPDRQVVGE